MKFLEHVLLYVLIPLVALSGGYSYFRFMVAHDYVVAYEGSCDPYIQKCFIACNNDGEDVSTCTDTHSYAKMQKYAVDLYAECGPDITNCEDANVCLFQDRKCSITYCDPANTEDRCSTGSSSTAQNDKNL